MPDPDLEAALAESCDLTRAEKLRIIVAQRDQQGGTHWVALGLRGDPSAADIKKAYFDLSKQFHPDRYFGKNLGSFTKRVEEVFRGLKEAYEVLGNDKKRALYRASHPPPAPRKRKPLEVVDSRFGRGKAKAKPTAAADAEEVTGPVGASGAVPDLDKAARLEARRAEILAQRRRKKTAPLQNQAKKARDLYELGLKQLADKDVVAAASSFEIAAAYAPNNAEYQARHEEVQQSAKQQRTRELIEQADLEAATGQVGLAARLYAEASDLIPTMTKHAMRAAECFAAASDRAKAMEYAERAVKASPRRKEARKVIAALLEAKGDVAGAISHLEIAASLDKGDGEVKKALKRLAKKAK